MADKLEFKEKLAGILDVAFKNNRKMDIDEVETYFEEDCLSDEQIGLVCDYLISQKVNVSGYEMKKGAVTEKDDASRLLTREEQDYLRQYRKDLDNMKHSADNMDRMSYYLPKIVDEAILLNNAEVFLGDIIQEGNISLMLALSECGSAVDDEREIMDAVRSGMQVLIESQTESKHQDRHIVEQISQLDETLKELKEELGREAYIEEAALRLSLTCGQVEDLMKLMGTQY